MNLLENHPWNKALGKTSENKPWARNVQHYMALGLFIHTFSSEHVLCSLTYAYEEGLESLAFSWPWRYPGQCEQSWLWKLTWPATFSSQENTPPPDHDCHIPRRKWYSLFLSSGDFWKGSFLLAISALSPHLLPQASWTIGIPHCKLCSFAQIANHQKRQLSHRALIGVNRTQPIQRDPPKIKNIFAWSGITKLCFSTHRLSKGCSLISIALL